MRLRNLLVVLLFLVTTSGFCGVRSIVVADAFYDGDPKTVRALAWSVSRAVQKGVSAEQFTTGSDRFNGEWALVTCQMAMIGLAQAAGIDPSARASFEPAAKRCLRYLASPEGRVFGTAAWGEDGLHAPNEHGHAYLGWLNLGLAAGLRLASDERAAATHQHLTDQLATRLATLPVHHFETYPGETYPPDLSVVAASVGVTHRHDPIVRAWLPKFLHAARDENTGLLHQTLSPTTGARGPVRGSGSALGAVALSHVDMLAATSLADAVRTELWATAVLSGTREVPRGAPRAMDIDSGPVILGLSVSGTGFSLGAARATRDRAWFRSLYRSAHVVGAPGGCGSRRWFGTGGTMGNAILLAMLTTGAPWPEQRSEAAR